MRPRPVFAATTLATLMVLIPLGCTGSSFCPDCSQNSPILGLNYQPTVLYTVGTPISANLPNPAGGTPVTYQVVNGALPAGLVLNVRSGHITGTPTTPGVYTLTVQGSNSASAASQVLTITVVPATPLTLEYATPVVFTAGTPISAQSPTLGQATPGIATTYALATGTLPDGLALNAASGDITGTPTTPGVSAFSVTATNGTRSATANAAYTVTPAGSMTLNYVSPLVFTEGTAIVTQSASLTNLTPGVALTFAVTSGALPTGLSLAADGSISGTPTVPGVYAFTVTATNGTRSAASSPTWTVTPAAALTLSYPTPRVFTQGTPIADQNPTLGHPTPGVSTTYTVTGGALPAGLTLNGGTGVISGTPTAAGVFAFTVAATNGTRSATSTPTYTVESSATLTLGYTTPQFFPVGAPIAAQSPSVGHATPGLDSTFAVTSGSLPAGLSLNADGTITGTPTTPGVSSFTVTVTNGTRTAQASATWTVESAATLTLSYATPQTFAPDVAIATQSPTVGQETPGVTTTFALTSGSLPTGLTLNANGVITGTPTVAGTYPFTVTATNGTRTASAAVSYTIQNPAPTALNYATPVTYTSGVAITNNDPNPSGGAPTSYTITSGSLPSGLTLNATTGVISGTPTVSGSFSVTVRGANVAGNTSQTVAMTVLAPVVANLSANPGTISVGQSTSLTAIFSGGTGAVDQGLGSVATGGGIPIGPFATPGTYTYILTVTNAMGVTVTSTATLTVVATPPNSVTFTVPTAGTTYTYGILGDPLSGLRVVVPDQGNAVCASTDLTVTRHVGEPQPGALATGVVAVSDPWTFSSTVGYPFRKPMTVTLPYDGSGLGAADVPVPFFWDPAYGKWVAAGLKTFDPVGQTVTFTTLLPGSYSVLAIPGLAASLNTASLGFAVGTDGWFQPNQGSFDIPGGSSFGMASFASWYFAMKKPANGNAGLYTQFLEGLPTSSSDDVSARALISRLANGTLETWGDLWTQGAYQLTNRQTGLALITGLRASGQPQVFLMAEMRPAADNGLATVVTGYNAGTGKFEVLDPNFPGMPLTITWNGTTGAFSAYDRAAAYVPTFAEYAFEGQTSIHRLTDYERVFGGATTAFPNPPFATLGVDDVGGVGAPSGGTTLEIPSASNVLVTGTVSNGSDTATHIYWSQNGGPRTPVSLAGNTFSFTIPALLDPYGTRIALETTANPCDPTFSFTGYTEFNLKELGRTAWFPNICFETGATAPWTLQQSNTAPAYPATQTFSTTTGEMNSYAPSWTAGSLDSALVTVGNDAYVPSIPRVFDGANAFRINDGATGAHVSRIFQNITIPADVATPKVTFYWAAVMQDPGHAPSEQPYVDIIVQDVTNNYETIYFKHFYAGDPSYPGWITNGQWKGINWQKVTLSNLSSRKGHVIRIRVMAGDCTLGGHAGYAYLDGVSCN